MNVLMKIAGAGGLRMAANVEGKVFMDGVRNLCFERAGYIYNTSEIEMLKTDNPVHTEFFMEMLNGVDDKNVFELSEDGWLINLTFLSKL